MSDPWEEAPDSPEWEPTPAPDDQVDVDEDYDGPDPEEVEHGTATDEAQGT